MEGRGSHKEMRSRFDLDHAWWPTLLEAASTGCHPSARLSANEAKAR
ncbi:unnamed protein product [Ascophyllum nodosum]